MAPNREDKVTQRVRAKPERIENLTPIASRETLNFSESGGYGELLRLGIGTPR